MTDKPLLINDVLKTVLVDGKALVEVISAVQSGRMGLRVLEEAEKRDPLHNPVQVLVDAYNAQWLAATRALVNIKNPL